MAPRKHNGATEPPTIATAMLEGPPAETVTPPASDAEPASETKVKALLPPFLAARTLKGDLVRFILDRLQHEQGDRRPWNERPEEQQRETIRQVGDAVEEALRRGFIMMQGDQSKLITALVGKIATGKNGWVAQVHFGDDGEKSLPLIRGSGKIVQIALADANAFLGLGEPVQVKADQAALPVEMPAATMPEPPAPVH